MHGPLVRALTLLTLPLLAAAAPVQGEAVRSGHHVCGTVAEAALGADLPNVAGRHGRSADDLSKQLRRDRSLCVDQQQRLYYVDAPIPPRRAVVGATLAAAVAPLPLASTFTLHSRPGASKTLFLDFDGHTVTSTSWNIVAGQPVLNVPAFNDPPTDDPATFSMSEQALIQGIWQRMAEDFAPFAVDVTTEYPGEAALTRAGAADTVYGTRVLFAGYSQAQIDALFGPAGGIAYVGSFDHTFDFFKPAFVFPAYLGPYEEKAMAEAASHEAGHTLGLAHDGRISPPEEYYEGHGAEPMTWAPIMGVGYYSDIVQWSRGEYPSANNTQDDLAMIASYVGYRPDDHSNTVAGATPLSATAFAGAGIIGTAADMDVFSFTSTGGALALSVQPAPNSPNLDILAEVLTSGGAVVASSNPTLQLGTEVSAPAAAGNYFLRVSGVGLGTLATGYSDYASVGRYTVQRVLPAGVGGKNLKISAPGPAINLSWTGGTAQTDYIVARAPLIPAGPTTFSAPLPANTTSYTDAAPPNSTLLCYVVVARDGSGATLGQSDFDCAYTGFADGTVVPGTLTLGLNQTNMASLTWTAPAGGPVDGYALYKLPFDGSPITFEGLGAGATSSVQNMGGTHYCYTLVAFRGGAFGNTNLVCGIQGFSTLAQPLGHTAHASLDKAMDGLKQALGDLGGKFGDLGEELSTQE